MHYEKFERAKIETPGAMINLVHGGRGEPLLLLHGYPQNHLMWHDVASKLSGDFYLVIPDLRGYGESSKPESSSDFSTYSKREMAIDCVEVMDKLGFDSFYVAGHDRGGRVAHRLTLDHPDKVKKVCVMDIAPTHTMYTNTDKDFATGYYHWFFLIQPDNLPETLIGNNSEYYLREKLKRWSGPGSEFDEDIVAEYIRCFSDPDAIHATCNDYRASATIDLEHDESDFDKRIQCPLLVLWGSRGFVHRTYDVLQTWREKAVNVKGRALECGHFVPEEQPAEVISELKSFFGDKRD